MPPLVWSAAARLERKASGSPARAIAGCPEGRSALWLRELGTNSDLSDGNAFRGDSHSCCDRVSLRLNATVSGSRMKRYAILRHAKIKPGRHLVGVGMHNTRSAATPNADSQAMPVEILVGTNKPHRDVMNALRDRGVLDRKLKSDANVAVEVFLGASPDWWASHGWRPGIHAEGKLLAVITEWKNAQIDYLKDRFGDLLVSAQFHPDEANPHIQGLVIPVQWRRDGREKGENAGREAWRLSTEQLLKSPKHLKKLQTEYANAMAPFGLVRGEDRETGTTWHQPLKEWQAQQAALSNALQEEILRQRTVTEQAELDAARIRQDALDHAQRLKDLAEREAKDHAELLALREEALRRKEDSAAAAQREIAAEHARLAVEARKIDAEKRQVLGLRQCLETMLAELERIMVPVREYAAKWRGASGLVRQAIGAKGPAASKIVEQVDTIAFDQMLAAANVRD